jgi:cytochrome b561
VYAALSVIVLSLAGFSALAARLSRASSRTREQLRGFLYVGAIALVVLAVAVVVVGLAGDRTAGAEGLAVFGLFTYALYLLAAYALLQLTDRP